MPSSDAILQKYKMRVYEFTGLSFKQNPQAPALFAFVASSNELVRFCGVARKSEKLLTNYQRALDEDRLIREVTPFFQIPVNCSPTAIVVSLHDTPISHVSFTDVEDRQLGDTATLRRLQIRFADPREMEDSDVVELVKGFIDARLAEGGALEDGADDEEEAPDDANGAEAEDEEQNAADEEDVEDEVEIGESVLFELRRHLDDPSFVTTDVAAALREMLLPALVIDGQHRLFGAARVEEDIPLLVCTMVNPDWKEQVFQFTVINDKARGIPRPFITSLAGMSLTATELEDLRSRLAQAGVQLWEVEVMQRLGYDPRSAFYDKIEFKVDRKKEKGLGYQTMKQLGEAWYEPRNQGLITVMRVLYQEVEGKKRSQQKLREQWQVSDELALHDRQVWLDSGCLAGRMRVAT